MKRAKKWFGNMICVLILLFCMNPAVFAAEDTKYYDCTLFLYGVNSVPEVVTQYSAIQVQAGDGSGDIWAVASYEVTTGATQYLATDPTDVNKNAYAELIAGDAASGIAVFRLANQVEGRTAPALRTLDGLTAGDTVAVAGISSDTDSMYFFSRAAYIEGLQTQNGYSRLTLADATYPLSELDIFPIAAVMTSENVVIGFYTGSYSALPSGYIMSSADGIGSLESGSSDDEPSTPPEDGTGESPSSGNYTIETVQGNTGVEDLLKQAEAERSQAKIIQIVLIIAAVAVAIGLIVFALFRSKKPQIVKSESPKKDEQPMGKTEYVGSQDYGKTVPAESQFYIVPLAGTPGTEREIPLHGLTFGRSPDCDVAFAPDTGGVSGKHCSLSWKGGALYLKDLGSSYGTLLEDGRKLSGEEAEVGDGTRFYLGSHKVGFQIIETH